MRDTEERFSWYRDAIEMLESQLSAAKEELEHQKQINGFNAESIKNGRAENERLRVALEKITAIENQSYGGDWDEIEEARLIAKVALEEL